MHRFPLLNLLLVGAGWLSGMAPATAQTRTMRLDESIQYALDNNPQLRIAQLQMSDADWRIKENTATGLPQISASVSYQYFIQRPGIPASALGFPGAGDEKIAFNAYHSLSPSITLNQLFFSNSYRLAKKAARFYRDYAATQLAVTRQTVRNQVIDAYLPALLLTENLEILDKNVGNLEKLLNETRAINQAGFAEQLDVDRLEFSLTTLRSQRDNLVRQRDIVINALKLAMGMPVSESIFPNDDVDKLLSQYASADLTSELTLANRPEYVQLRQGRDLSTIQADLSRKPWLPTVSGFIQYGPAFQGGFGDDTKWFFIPSAVAGVQVNIPIWDGGGTKARLERAIIAIQTIDEQEKLLVNALHLELDNARKQYLNAQESVANRQKNLALAQRIYEATQTKYKAGIGSSFELVDAEQQLYAAQQALMQAQYDLLTARTAIQKALGGQ